MGGEEFVSNQESSFIKNRLYSILDEILATIIIFIAGAAIGSGWYRILPVIKNLNWLVFFVTIVAIILFATSGIWIWKKRQKLIRPIHQAPVRRNPFRVGPPVIKENFYGRRKEIDLIYNSMSQGGCCSVVGTRKMGKTSILKHLSNSDVLEELGKEFGIEPEKYLFIFYDLERINNESDFWEKLQKIYRNLALKIKIDLSYENSNSKGFERFETFLQQLSRNELRTILFLDEFDAAINKMGEMFFSILRSFHGEYKISYVIASTTSLTQFINQGKLPITHFFNIFKEIELGFFSIAEAREMLMASSEKGGIPFEEDDVDFLYRIAGPHPFFLQMAGSELFFKYSNIYKKYLSKNKIILDKKDLYEKIRQELASSTHSHFEYYFNNLKDIEKEALQKIITGREKETDPQIINILMKYNLIMKDKGSYVPFSRLFHDFILNKF